MAKEGSFAGDIDGGSSAGCEARGEHPLGLNLLDFRRYNGSFQHPESGKVSYSVEVSKTHPPLWPSADSRQSEVTFWRDGRPVAD